MIFSYKTIIKITGLLLGITGIAMVPPFLFSLYYGEEKTPFAFAISAGFAIVIGFTLFAFIPSSKKALKIRDGYLIVMLCWIICSIFGAFPYLLSGQEPSFASAIFDSVSGYTTTGATALTTTSPSNSLILWKTITNWLGGMGILVFIISILPTLGIGGQRIIAAETPGPELSKIAPTTHQLARYLYIIYISITVLGFIILMVGSDLGIFESIINTLGSVSTSGLVLHPQGVLGYDSLFVELTISFLTILGSVNFILYIHLIKGNFKSILQNVELRVYLAIIAIATLVITLSLKFSGLYESIWQCLRYAFGQVASFATTSGFGVKDYTQWPAITQLTLITLIFIGGSAASTSGGIKVVRLMVMCKLVARGFFKRVHPRAISSIKIGHKTVSAPVVSAITAFTCAYFLTFLVGSLVISLQGFDLATTMSTTFSLISSTGASFGDIGPAGDYAAYSSPMKLFLSLLMIVGRLELFTVFLFFMPSFWNPNKYRSE